VTAHLAHPIGDRSLIEEQFNRRQPVYDGSLLATPTWMPPGWRFRYESGAPDRPGGQINSWFRAYGPDRPAPEQNRCTPGDPGLNLTQMSAQQYAGGNGETQDVHGRPAVYSVNSQYGWVSARLSWDERNQGFVIESTPGCMGDVPTSKETMLRLARSLAVP
jgi:hypothetical protein